MLCRFLLLWSDYNVDLKPQVLTLRLTPQIVVIRQNCLPFLFKIWHQMWAGSRSPIRRNILHGLALCLYGSKNKKKKKILTCIYSRLLELEDSLLKTLDAAVIPAAWQAQSQHRHAILTDFQKTYKALSKTKIWHEQLLFTTTNTSLQAVFLRKKRKKTKMIAKNEKFDRNR